MKSLACTAASLLVAVAGSEAGLRPASAQPPRVDVVVYSGQPAPGLPGVTINVLNNNTPPYFSNRGEAAFVSSLAGEGVVASNNTAVFYGRPGMLMPVLRTGSASVQVPGATISILNNFIALGADGTLSVNVRLAATPPITTANDSYILSGDPTVGLALVAREGDPAPDLGGPTYGLLSTVPRLSATGRSVYSSSLAGGVTTANDNAIFTGAPGSAMRLLREGDPAPGFPTGINIASYDSVLQIDPSGGVLVFATTTTSAGPGVTSSNNQGLYYATPSGLTLLARTGTQAAGFDAGINYGFGTFAFGSRAIDADGQFLFVSSLSGLAGTENVTLFAGQVADPSTLAPLARRSLPVPGLLDVAYFNFTTSAPAGSGRIFSAVSFTGPGAPADADTAIMQFGAGGPQVLVREGDPAPEIPGATLGQLSNVVANRAGTIVFSGALLGAVEPGNDAALFIKRLGEPARLLLREGQSIELAPGDSRSLQSLFSIRGGAAGNGAQSGSDIGLNDRDELLVRVTVAEPAATAFLLVTLPASCNVADIVSIGGFPPADGELTVDDYTSFINAFAGDEILADIVAIGGFPPADGQLTVDDYTSFINAFAEGCPG